MSSDISSSFHAEILAAMRAINIEIARSKCWPNLWLECDSMSAELVP
ncbi:hypothetical protein GYH30_028570 [Glycine max]|nr:hypothetical protein GYH30_028570 [Glycine max]